MKQLIVNLVVDPNEGLPIRQIIRIYEALHTITGQPVDVHVGTTNPPDGSVPHIRIHGDANHTRLFAFGNGLEVQTIGTTDLLLKHPSGTSFVVMGHPGHGIGWIRFSVRAVSDDGKLTMGWW